jgi:hypothetical protein
VVGSAMAAEAASDGGAEEAASDGSSVVGLGG